MIIKPLASEISVTAANTVGNSRLVRAYAAAVSVVTIANEDGVVGTFTVPAASVTLIEKEPLNTISGTTALLCTPVSYKS
jgi:hypothetical protein